jgi:hypothetical protein
MKFVVTNFSGNVGKSTISKHILFRLLPACELFSVESINDDDSDKESIRGRRFGELMDWVQVHEHVVVDVGSSNVEDFILRMSQYKGSHQDFDLFIVPTVPSNKQQIDTISTVNALSSMGIPSEKIRIIFNRVDSIADLRKTFNKVFSSYELNPNFTIEPFIAIQENEIYGLLQGRSLQEILEDPTDFAQKIKEAKSKEEKLEWSKRRGVQRLALGVKEELSHAFSLLVEGA